MRGHAVFMVNVNPVDGSNFVKREGADKDADTLQRAFCTNLGFNWLNQNNARDLRRSDWVHSEKVAPPNCNCITCKIHNENHRDSECFLLVISSHGREENGEQKFRLNDGKIVTLSELIETLSDKKCPTLEGKTRILILQSCRSNLKLPEDQRDDHGFEISVEAGIKALEIDDTGTNAADRNDAQKGNGNDLGQGDQLGHGDSTAADADQEGSDISSSGEESDPDPEEETIEQPRCDIPHHFLILYPCASGKRSKRRPSIGSWLIYDLCKVIDEHDFKNDTEMNFLKILTGAAGRVARRDASKTQFKNAPSIVHRLVKPLIFEAIADEAKNVPVDTPAL